MKLYILAAAPLLDCEPVKAFRTSYNRPTAGRQAGKGLVGWLVDQMLIIPYEKGFFSASYGRWISSPLNS